ncbi:transferrin receptor 1b [Echeneis naucrates]|uniref:Transferrin receptor protein 1-like n=1 Tax=Echeneis naucrates TaxID=173247 RepID=A0A665X5Q7_ECHNA|nr:transferrin receptor protein 1-like [Echeneis naucrates]
MDRLRSAFNSLIKPEQYSRFTLQPAEDGERHVEVKLSDDATEVEDQPEGSPSFRPAPLRQNRRHICYLALGALLIFLTGYLLGFVSHHKHQVEPQVDSDSDSDVEDGLKSTSTFIASPPDVQQDWKEVSNLLNERLTAEAFEKTLGTFDLPQRSAGSEEDMNQANRIFDEFKMLEMDPWTDVHYAQLQIPNSSHPNRVLFESNVFEPVGYLAYSATGTVQGKLVYGNYGRQEDLDVLQKNNVELKDSVVLLRCGNISFAEQVNNAEKKGASAVLIYPDLESYKYIKDAALYGHVHLGSGDPYTPGFPSFNHTQFPPTQSSGLPKILAQTITANMASTLLQSIDGPEPDASSGFKGGFSSVSYRLGGSKNVTVEVNNVLVSRELHNVFGVIRGFTDPDRYVVLGAQRDAWGTGYARAAVGTSILMELAKAFHNMVENDGFRPRRSIVFASWSAGEYGNVGATEWLEGYMTSLDKRVFTYINLDGAVLGVGNFVASASPLLYSLIERTMKEVKNPTGAGSVYDMVGKEKWMANVLKPMTLDDPAYPFLALSGVPSISFHFTSANAEPYLYYGTVLDNKDHLLYQTTHHTSEITVGAAQFAGQMALRLVHDHLISLDIRRYSSILSQPVKQVYMRIKQLTQSGQLKDVSPNWLNRARNSFHRAAENINRDIGNTDLSDKEACRNLNDRIMKVEHSLLSPYVSPLETPFRHLLLGRGSHTLASIGETTDMEELHIQLAMATWTLKGCANALVGDIWAIDNEI